MAKNDDDDPRVHQTDNDEFHIVPPPPSPMRVMQVASAIVAAVAIVAAFLGYDDGAVVLMILSLLLNVASLLREGTMCVRSITRVPRSARRPVA